MDRLNKKCFVASTGLHLLLGAAIFVGPAFTASNSKNDADLPVINFEPDILVDADIVGGGNPRAARQPASQPPAPQPQPQPVPQPTRPEPKVVERRPPEPLPKPETRTDPDSFEQKAPIKPKVPQISTKLETKKAIKKPSANVDTAQERQYAENMLRVADVLKQAGNAVRNGAASATAIEEGSPGSGGGGPSYASYRAWVQRVFDTAWLAPDNAAVDAAVARVRVVIARDGTVLSAEFISLSGDGAVDGSIQRALDRVPTIGKPFPEGAKENQRAYILRFDLKVKRGLA